MSCTVLPRALLLSTILASCATPLPLPSEDDGPGPTTVHAQAPPALRAVTVEDPRTRLRETSEWATSRAPIEIPVLLFHQICETACGPNDIYGITHAEFRRMMVALKSDGYESISMSDFVRAHGGDATGIPARPILLTFDDGRVDAYLGADDVMEELDLQATMFVLTVEGARNAFYMQWSQVMEAAASGRWTIQLHAHAGHSRVRVGVDAMGAPVTGSFFGWRQCDPLGGSACPSLEPFEDWKQRAEQDIDTGVAVLAARLGSAYSSLSMALPFGDYGQFHSNDPRISTELRTFLNSRFPVWFTQPSRDPDFMRPSLTTHEVPRFTIAHTATAESVLAWLKKHRTPPSTK